MLNPKTMKIFFICVSPITLWENASKNRTILEQWHWQHLETSQLWTDSPAQIGLKDEFAFYRDLFI